MHFYSIILCSIDSAKFPIVHLPVIQPFQMNNKMHDSVLAAVSKDQIDTNSMPLLLT